MIFYFGIAVGDADLNMGDRVKRMEDVTAGAIALSERYKRNPVLRVLVGLIPYGSTVEVAALGVVDRIREDRSRTFFDELANANGIENPELLESEDFIHCFFATAKFALNTRRREKIRMFGRLLKCAALADSGLSDVDEYEDFLGILDEISYRELRGLAILDGFSESPRAKDQNDMQWTIAFWDDFSRQLSAELQLPEDEVADYMRRLGRTGCFQELAGYYDGPVGVGKLTPTYMRLKEFVRERA